MAVLDPVGRLPIGAAEPIDGDVTPDLERILLEVKKGCKDHEKGINEAQEITDYYDGESEKYIPYRPSEDTLSWLTRPKRISMITRQAVDGLTSHLYKPGPRNRRIASDDAVSEWYSNVCQDIHINGLMQHADRLATLHGICAIGVYPMGESRRPINYHLYPRHEFAYWASPNNPRQATAICTITKFNADTTRYRLWTDTAYYTFYKGKDWGYMPGGWNTARYDPATSGPHGYGVLPFCFVTHALPTITLETKGLGCSLKKINLALNIDKSNLALWVHHYARPLGFVSGVGPDWRPKFVEGGFVPLITRHDSTEDSPVIPSASYLESSFDIKSVLDWTLQNAAAGLREVGIPDSLASKVTGGGGTGAPSGLAIAANDADLITYTKGRQSLFEVHESELAKLVCKIGASEPAGLGSMAASLERAAADPSLRVSWPQPSIDLPGQAMDLADQWELDNGITDPIEVIMRRQGLDEREAVEQYRRVQLRRQQAVVIASLAAQAVDATTGDVIGALAEAATPPPVETEADGTPVEPVGEMGVPGGLDGPSSQAQPSTVISPSVTVTAGSLPNDPITLVTTAQGMTGGTEI